MVSSPEAGSGSSSSEDEFDLGSSAVRATAKTDNSPSESAPKKPIDASKLFSDDEDDDDGDADTGSADSGTVNGAEAANKGKKAGSGGSSDEDRDKEKEMEDLFGSDYDSEEEEFKASGIKESPVREENRVSADLYTEEHGDHGSHSNEIWLPRSTKAPKGANYFICKMPNILRLVPEAYTKQSIEEEMRNPSDEMLYRNYVRWRYQRDAAGNVKIDPKTKRPLRESNAKLVQWEDGTFTMFVGKEALNLSRQKIPNSFLFANEISSDKPQVDEDPDAPGQEMVLECHGRLKEKFTIRPTTTSSKSHKSLTMSMRAKHNKGVQKVKQYISELDGEREQEQRAKINDDLLRLQNRKKARQTYEYDRERGSRMDASFLEEGSDYDEEDNVAAIKEQFGGRSRNKAGAARRPGAGAKRPPQAPSFRGGGFDEYSRSRAREAEKSDSEPEHAEEDEEEEEDEDDIVVRSVKKRRTVDEEDSE